MAMRLSYDERRSLLAAAGGQAGRLITKGQARASRRETAFSAGPSPFGTATLVQVTAKPWCSEPRKPLPESLAPHLFSMSPIPFLQKAAAVFLTISPVVAAAWTSDYTAASKQ